MANITLNAGTGGSTLATEQNGSSPNENYQKVEIVGGQGGAFANGLNVSAAGAALVAANGVFPVSDNSSSLTVDAPVGTPVFVRLSDGSSAVSPALEAGNLATLLGRFPATAALADATANPSLSKLQSFLMGYNGTTWDRLKSTSGSLNVHLDSQTVTVDGSGVTQPVSGTISAAQSGTWSVKVTDGTNFQPTGDSSARSIHTTVDNASLAVTGTFWQATQPVSGTVTANAGSGVYDVTPASPAANDYLPVRLTDGSSFYTASGGGGGGTSSNFSSTFPSAGTAAGASDGTNMQPLLVDGSGNLKVNVAAGGASGGTSSSFSATFPSTGTAAGASDGTNMKPLLVDGSGYLKVAQQGTVTVSGTVTTSPPSNASTNLAQLAGTTTDTNSGNKSAGTLRVVLATDQPQLTNALKVDGSAVTQPVSGTFWQATQPVSLASVPSHAVTNAGTFAVQAAQSGTWTVQPGNTANTTPWLTTPTPTANSGWSFSYQSALSSTKQQIKGSAGTFGGFINLFNPNTATTYIQVFNKASGSVTVGTTTPDFVITLPGIASASGTGSDRNLEITCGLAMSTGITVAATTTATGSTAPSNAVVGTFLFL